MAAVQQNSAMPATSTATGPKTAIKYDDANGGPGSQVAHTLTACTRCRQRKTRCDPGLPKCGPCERTSSTCEYYDSSKGHNVNRNYVVYLQHKVNELEKELEKVENEDSAEDPEAMMRAATVRMYDAKESKYLGPSSGIAITRLVMQLAKQFTDAKSIMDIVPEQRARHIKELYQQEQAKPTSKIYPLISDVAAAELPNRQLADLLIQLYKLKVQPMYPALHEPTLDKDFDAVYSYGQASPYQNFVCRMVLAVSLQKIDTQYAGLADSYYLAALTYLEPVVQPMDLKTLQCFALMAEYSLLTPTRTAIYYVVGIAVRLAQALGYNEEKTVTRGRPDGKIDYLEIDMRRRVFWCILVMECGLAHSLGRPAILATSHEHIDVGWFESCDDQYIRPEGVDPAAPKPTLKKWIAIHFFKMRLLQLEIRRKLYQRKRSQPKDDSDPWFHKMDAKLCAWRDAAPNSDEGIGLDKIWFVGRYNTMVVFLYRPSPQVSRPTVSAALKCFEACHYNIYMQREQIKKGNVDLTWIFTQSIFMSINTVLWALSYVEVRRKYGKAEVKSHLEVAMEAIQLASERWPGVASAVQLYQNLIAAILKIYEKDGDVPIAANTPSDVNSPLPVFADGLSQSSPATVSSISVTTPPADGAPFGHFHHHARRSVEQPPPVPYRSDSYNTTHTATPPLSTPPATTAHAPQYSNTTWPTYPTQQTHMPGPQLHQPTQYDPQRFNNPLPELSPELGIWSTAPQPVPIAYATHTSMPTYEAYSNAVFDPNNQAYPFPSNSDPTQNPEYMNQYMDYENGAFFGNGLNQDQQQELMQSLETSGMEDIQSMISSTLASIAPKPTRSS
ncbi:hypothetical protein B0A50_06097 [Salinomyces thailandicus]|uniref:Zn(2)-C6 fungal-type domain-containing protein n=1 Tax=Salinomyces thailandicus TaxID=706561 RepID=A0A4V5N3T8_9PEZI|nr:hypothetical protein B0A50_06097 [Salinomyces thailandica]